jgi:Uma2 family endonuclease
VPRAAIWISANTYLEPDLFYVSKETEAALDPEHRTTADLVIEVISPGSAIYDRNTKADTYAALDIKELWLVDETFETIEVRNQTGKKDFDAGVVLTKGLKLNSLVLADLSLAVSQVFEG